MSRPDFDVREEYVGNDSLATYSFDFKIESLDHLEVVTYDATGVEIERVRGTDVVYLSAVSFDPINGGGTVTLQANLPNSYRLLLLLANDEPTQPSIYRQKFDFTLKKFEESLDFILGPVQRLAYLMRRTLRVDDLVDPDVFNLMIPSGDPLYLLRRNAANTGFEWVDAETALSDASGGPDGTIGLPTDGTYGGILGDPTRLAEGDTYEDAYDKIVTLLGKMVPAPPEDLSDKTLAVVGGYTALEATTGTSHTNVTDDTTPVITNGVNQNITDGFAEATSGVLSAEVDSVEVGSITLTAGDDAGTDGELEIVADFDPYNGQGFGLEGIYEALVARINSAVLSVGSHTARLLHTLTGNTPVLTFYIDDPGIPVISNEAITGSGTGRFVSGVPSLATGDTITCAFDVDDAVKTHYNATRIGRAQSAVAGSANAALPGSPPAPDAQVAISIPLTVLTSQYSENASVTAIAYNSRGDLVTENVTGSIRVDTVSNESARVTSGTGQYPATGYDGAYDSTDSLATNVELQMLNGQYQYPPATNYASNLPTAGPNYTSLSADAFSRRWVTFNLGAITAQTSRTITLSNTTNLGATVLISDFNMYVKVEGATGWLDANAAYPGVGNPASDGDAALDVGGSTVTSRRVTFGATPRTGDVIVRIGLPAASTKRIGSVS